jgi:predicted transcriptional regulator
MMPREQVHSFKLDQRGMARVFGELEAAIMEDVWDMGDASVAEVCERMGPAANYKTVMTVMNRLVQKRILVRRRDGRAFVYRAVEPREAFLTHVSRRVVEGLLQDFGAMAVAQFVDALDTVDPALLQDLEARVRRRDGTESA